MERTDDALPATGTPAATTTVPIAPKGPVLEDPRKFVCRSKDCKKTRKPDDATSKLLRCSIALCPHLVHSACLQRLYELFACDEDPSRPVCSKRCFNALQKQLRVAAVESADAVAKKRVRWDNDGPTPDVSSMGCIIDWLTSGSNYKRFTGAEPQSGDTKTSIADEVVRLIAQRGIKTVRLAKDVVGRIGALEQSFKCASDWLAGTGTGVDDEKSLKHHILMRCQYFYELLPVMDEKHTTRALLTNKDKRFKAPDTVPAEQDEQDDDGSVDDDDVTYVTDDECRAAGSSAPRPAARSDADASTQPTSRPKSAPLTVARQPTRKKKTEPTGPHQSYLDLKEKQLDEERDFKKMKLDLREKELMLQHEQLRLKRLEAEANAKESHMRQEEAAERTKRHKYEAEHWRVQASVTLLRERAKLLQDGVPQADIDRLLPLSHQLE